MGREVITETDVKEAKVRQAAAGSLGAGAENIPTADDYGDRLIKFIPSEVVSVYLFTAGLLRSADNLRSRKILEWAVFIFLLIMTPVYLNRVQSVKKYQTLAIVTVSFAVWVFTLGGPFTQFEWYHPIHGALLLPLYTFAAALWKPEK